MRPQLHVFLPVDIQCPQNHSCKLCWKSINHKFMGKFLGFMLFSIYLYICCFEYSSFVMNSLFFLSGLLWILEVFWFQAKFKILFLLLFIFLDRPHFVTQAGCKLIIPVSAPQVLGRKAWEPPPCPLPRTTSVKNIKDVFRGIELNLQSALGDKDILSVLTLTNWMWWHTPVIPAPMGQWWSDWEFQASLGYIVRPDLK